MTVFSEEVKTALQNAAEALRHVFEEISAMYKAIEELACAAQEAIESRKEERERWGRPSKRLLATYNRPVKKIRPYARSFGRR